MQATCGTELDFLLHQLDWSLGQPLVHGDRCWADRVGRTLDRLAGAFDQHVKEVVRPGGVLEQIAEADVLPFTAEAREAAQLRRQQQLIGARLHSTATQLRGALGLFPPPGDSADVPDAPRQDQDTRAFMLFKALEPCIADVLADLSACLAIERSLLQAGSAAGEER
jgi:hypothetical protein